MLACPNGTYLPLVAKYNLSSNAPVFELDTILCPDVQFVVRKPPPHIHRAMPQRSNMPGETAHAKRFFQ
jgi:hypothetical protein